MGDVAHQRGFELGQLHFVQHEAQREDPRLDGRNINPMRARFVRTTLSTRC
jgi:hypothetical protein